MSDRTIPAQRPSAYTLILQGYSDTEICSEPYPPTSEAAPSPSNFLMSIYPAAKMPPPVPDPSAPDIFTHRKA